MPHHVMSTTGDISEDVFVEISPYVGMMSAVFARKDQKALI